MGFFDDAVNFDKKIYNTASDPAGLWNPGSASYGATRGPAPAPPGMTDPRRTDRPYVASNKSAQGLADSIFNDSNSTDYGSTFDTAYQNLGQPAKDPNRNELYTAGTRALASSFADSVYKQTGTLPTEDQVRKFVGETLTPGFAQKFIVGMAPDQINSLADSYIKGNPDALTTPGTQSAEQQRLAGLNDQFNKIYDTGQANLISNYDTNVYGPAKQNTTNDLAGQGMLENPNSRYALNALDANRSRDLASGFNTLESNRASGQVDLGKTIEDLLQQDANRNQNAYQFNKNYNAQQDNTAFNQGLVTKQLSVADTLGRLMANGQSNNGISGALGGALGGGTSGALLGSKFGPVGAAAGGIGGLLLGGAGGYFGTKR